jgi:hypothetical protein
LPTRSPALCPPLWTALDLPAPTPNTRARSLTDTREVHGEYTGGPYPPFTPQLPSLVLNGAGRLLEVAPTGGLSSRIRLKRAWSSTGIRSCRRVVGPALTSPSVINLHGYQPGRPACLDTAAGPPGARSQRTATSCLDCHQARELHKPTACAAREPKPFSRQRRQAATDSGHTRRPEGHLCPGTSRCADRQPGLHRIVSLLILKSSLLILRPCVRNNALSWSGLHVWG